MAVIKSPLTISIPNPCAQDWDEMERTENGKYCSQCQKEVIDFSGLTDKQLYSLLKNRKNIPCGRFYSSQLNHPILPITPRVSPCFSLSKKIAAIFAFLSLEFTESAAQISTPTTVQNPAKNLDSKTRNQAITINGVIRDETGVVIEGAEIRLNDLVVAKSDTSGRFWLELEAASMPKVAIFQFNAPGRVTVVRSYHSAMQSTSYDIILAEPHKHCNHGYTMGKPVFSPAFEPFKIVKPVEALTPDLRAKLAEAAIGMRNDPSSVMLLVGYGTTQKEVRNANRMLAAVKDYFVNREGISETRIHTKVKTKQFGEVDTADVFSKQSNEELN